MGSAFPQFLAGILACLGAVAAGCTLGWSAPAQGPIMDGAYGFRVSVSDFSWIGSIVTLGAGVACIPTGILCNLIGRKVTMLIMVVPFTVGWLLLIFAPSVIFLVLARFILGVSGGSFCIAAPMYTTEIVEKKKRGMFGNFFQLFLVNGVLFAYVVGPMLNVKYYSGVCGVVPVIFFICFVFMPESPIYFISKGKMDKAEKSMKFLRGKDNDNSAEINEMVAEDKESKENKVPFLQIFKRRPVVRGLLLGLPLHIIQQASGINTIIFYSTDLFAKSSSSITPNVSTIIVGLCLVIGTFISIFVVDVLGRRVLLLISCAFMALFTTIMGVYLFVDARNPASLTGYTWVPLISICGYILVFSLGIGPCPWLLVMELFTADCRGPCSALCGTTNWLMAFTVTSTYAGVSGAIGAGVTFWIYSAVSIVGGIYIFFFLPETKGKTIAEIQAKLGG